MTELETQAKQVDYLVLLTPYSRATHHVVNELHPRHP